VLAPFGVTVAFSRAEVWVMLLAEPVVAVGAEAAWERVAVVAKSNRPARARGTVRSECIVSPGSFATRLFGPSMAGFRRVAKKPFDAMHRLRQATATLQTKRRERCEARHSMDL
jgi:hypothetical protein